AAGTTRTSGGSFDLHDAERATVRRTEAKTKRLVRKAMATFIHELAQGEKRTRAAACAAGPRVRASDRTEVFMLRVDVTGSRLVIEQRNRFALAMAIVFLALTVLTLVAALVGTHARPGDMIAPVLTCALVGVVYGFVPNRRSFEADKASGDM